MAKGTRLAVFLGQDKGKREELNQHISRLERLILQDDSELKTKEIISSVSPCEPEDHEIDRHIDNVYYLDKFRDLLRAQMLVSICGYFEYTIKRIFNQSEDNPLKKKDGLTEIIDKLHRLEIIN